MVQQFFPLIMVQVSNSLNMLGATVLTAQKVLSLKKYSLSSSYQENHS